jgi:hypothetical protein
MSKIEVDTIEPQSGTTLTIGASGDTITIPSGATLTNNGTATGFGKVLQVVTATDSTSRNTTSTTFVTASNTLSVAITPSSTSNKIFVIVTVPIHSGTGGKKYFGTIFRNATNLGDATDGMVNCFDDGSERTIGNPTALSILDSPNTTSAITYQLYVKSEAGSAGTFLMFDDAQASITAFEIAG